MTKYEEIVGSLRLAQVERAHCDKKREAKALAKRLASDGYITSYDAVHEEDGEVSWMLTVRVPRLVVDLRDSLATIEAQLNALHDRV